MTGHAQQGNSNVNASTSDLVLSSPLPPPPMEREYPGRVPKNTSCTFFWDTHECKGYINIGLSDSLPEESADLLDSNIAQLFRVFVEQWRFWEGSGHIRHLHRGSNNSSMHVSQERWFFSPPGNNTGEEELFGIPYLKFTGDYWQIWLTGMRVPVSELHWKEQDMHLASFIERLENPDLLHVEASLGKPEAWQEALRAEACRRQEAITHMEKKARR